MHAQALNPIIAMVDPKDVADFQTYISVQATGLCGCDIPLHLVWDSS